MHQHHSTVRLFWGLLALVILGLAGCLVFLYIDFHSTVTAVPSASHSSSAEFPMASSSAGTPSELVPGLVSDTPPPGPSTTTKGHAFAR